jgi:hypothetical protein
MWWWMEPERRCSTCHIGDNPDPARQLELLGLEYYCGWHITEAREQLEQAERMRRAGEIFTRTT